MATAVLNTLEYRGELCKNCGMCSIVCPHGVFAAGEDRAELVNKDACMECGSCRRNCPSGAIKVSTGVGCATGMIQQALKGNKLALAEKGIPTSCECDKR